MRQVGHATLTVPLPNGTKEDYLITLPRLCIEGLWYGSSYIELSDTSCIQSSSSWLSTIKSQDKGYFSGKSHSFKADLTNWLWFELPGEQFRGAVECHK